MYFMNVLKSSSGIILHCPCCPKEKPNLDEKTKLKVEAAQCIGELLGDDIDGMAATLEDFGLV